LHDAALPVTRGAAAHPRAQQVASMADVEALAREVLAQRAAGASAHAVFSLPRGAPLADVRARYKKARTMRTNAPPARHLLRVCAHAADAQMSAPPRSWRGCCTRTRRAARWLRRRSKARLRATHAHAPALAAASAPPPAAALSRSRLLRSGQRRVRDAQRRAGAPP
jgi:hypothetical protein